MMMMMMMTMIKFLTILQKHGNSMAKGRFHGLTQNSVGHVKLWALLVMQLSRRAGNNTLVVLYSLLRHL